VARVRGVPGRCAGHRLQHQIAEAPLPEVQAIWHATTGLDAPVDRHDPSPASVQGLGGQFLLQGACLATGLLHGHADRHLGKRAHQQAQLLPQPTPHRQGIRRRLSPPLVLEAASTRVTEHEDREGRMDQQDMFDRLVFFLAALTRGLGRRVVGADDPPLSAVMGTRGDAGAVARGTGFSSSGVSTVTASASETPQRCARAVSERAGASPRARSAASSAGRRT
jgi:hypothetical protein